MWKRALPLTLLVPLSCAYGQSQTPAPSQTQLPEFRASVNRVNVLITATDNKGRLITDLAQEEFHVYEDGKLQQITNFSRQTELPLAVGFLIDTSSSVSTKLSFEKEASTNFIYSVMRDNDRALLVEFDTGVTLLQDLTSSANEIVRKIAKLKTGGGTSLFDAIYEVVTKKLKDLPDRKAIVILSDGADQNSKTTLDEVLETVRRADVILHIISTSAYGASGDHAGDKALLKLAEETGGRVYFPYTASQMEQYFDAINKELRSQYNIAYQPTNNKKDGAYRSIEIKMKRDNIKLRHKKGYRVQGS